MTEARPDDDQPHPLCWEASYEIVLALKATHPDVRIDSVGLAELQAMIVALPGFADDPALAHDALLCEILREWYEESDAD
jgi:FeS assembly protein IscX